MCNYETLYHNEKNGYVILCAGCNNIQLTFGNFSINFTKKDFAEFVAMVKRLSSNQQDSQNMTVKSVVIPTACEGVRMLLSRDELNQLNLMLDSADSELQSLELMSLFEGN